MGTYLNPGNRGFKNILNDTYVDKTGLIDFVNQSIDTPRKLICFSRSRRFGKSFAAKMLCAYYDKSCDSRMIFEGLEISGKNSFAEYLNKYNVIYLDITWFISTTSDISHLVDDLQGNVIRELRDEFPNTFPDIEKSLPRVLSAIAQRTGSEFIIIIDEWDALFREAKENKQIQQEYVKLLRGLFKGGTATDESIAAAYMTGILPIKKYGTESALTDFEEYTMANPDELAEYVGFTESEVRNLCESQNMDFEEMKCWYDGYSYEGIGSVYSPNSVMSALRRRSFRSYWSSSETYESLKNYISMDFDGLKTAILSMLGGTPVKVKISTFQNDLTSFKNKDDILTLLIHLGYLAYDARTELARIPNLEVSDAFGDAVSEGDWKYIGRAIRDSEDLLEATLRCDADAVAEALEQIHSLNASVLEYNNEASLSSAIMIAYYTAKRYYKVVREFPEGKGFADIVFMPRRNTDKPALLIELKYNRSADSAIKQIHDRCYDGDLKEFFGNLLLVGINYDRNAKGNTMKKHTCIIEKI